MFDNQKLFTLVFTPWSLLGKQAIVQFLFSKLGVCGLHRHVFPETADKYFSSEHRHSQSASQRLRSVRRSFSFPLLACFPFLQQLRVSQHLLFGKMAVLPLLLEGEENAVGLLAPLLFGDVNAGRRRWRERRAASVVARLSRAPDVEGRTNLTRKLTQETEDDGSPVMDVNRTYRDEKERKMGFLKKKSSHLLIDENLQLSPETVMRLRCDYAF